MAEGVNAINKLQTMMDKKEIDAIVDDYWVFFYSLLDDAGHSNYKVAGCQPIGKIFIAFSPAKPEQSTRHAKILSEGLTEMLKSGEMTKLYNKYGVAF